MSSDPGFQRMLWKSCGEWIRGVNIQNPEDEQRGCYDEWNFNLSVLPNTAQENMSGQDVLAKQGNTT